MRSCGTPSAKVPESLKNLNAKVSARVLPLIHKRAITKVKIEIQNKNVFNLNSGTCNKI